MIRSAQWALAALFFVLAACAGATARTEALLPAMREAWPPIREGAAREIVASGQVEAGPSLAAADEAITTGDPVKVAAAPWAVVDSLAAADIDRREPALGPNSATSLRERLRQFQAARASYTRRQP
jgi:hypothetical protein